MATLEETLVAEPPPLRRETDGTMRVGRTRVTLDAVVGAFNDGCSAEEVLSKYPSLQLADIYAVFAHYLRHRAAIDAYMERRQQEAAALRVKIEKLCPPDGFRERLLARQQAKT
jgi:uncharacterized protein (DUF433 family)